MKDTILEKSKELFLRNGFKTVGMDDIAQSLHISKKTIYQHFPSKDDLVKAVLGYIYGLAFSKIAEISGKCETAIHEHFKIKESIDGILGKDFETSPCFFQLKKYYPELCYDFEKRRCKDIKTHIEGNISEGIKQGVYRKNLDKTFLAAQFIAGSDAIDLYEKFPEEIGKSISMKERDDKFLEFYLRSIVTPKGLEIVENLIKNENEI
jgi:transcriptional regulator, TetR family